MKNTAGPGFFVFYLLHYFPRYYLPALLCLSSGPGEGWCAAGLGALGCGCEFSAAATCSSWKSPNERVGGHSGVTRMDREVKQN